VLAQRQESRLRVLAGRLDALSPLAVLGRGYSITHRRRDGVILRSSAEIEAGEQIEVRLSRGRLYAVLLEALAEEVSEAG